METRSLSETVEAILQEMGPPEQGQVILHDWLERKTGAARNTVEYRVVVGRLKTELLKFYGFQLEAEARCQGILAPDVEWNGPVGYRILTSGEAVRWAKRELRVKVGNYGKSLRKLTAIDPTSLNEEERRVFDYVLTRLRSTFEVASAQVEGLRTDLRLLAKQTSMPRLQAPMEPQE